MKPSALNSANFAIPKLESALSGLEPGAVAYRAGKVYIIVAPPTRGQGYHMSISRRDRYPSWDEIVYYRYLLLPDTISMVMVLPSRDEYVNLHENCFHLHEELT